MFAYCANNPVMYSDITGYFMVGVMIASIFVSLAFEVYEDFHDDGDFHFGWKYLGATVSGFFSGLTGGVGSLILYSFLGNTLDYLISGEFSPETFGQDLVLIGISSAIGVGIGKSFKFGVSRIKANSLFNLGNNSIANSILNKMGLGAKIGSNSAKANLSGIIYKSSKYFIGELVANIGCNTANNGILLIFD